MYEEYAKNMHFPDEWNMQKRLAAKSVQGKTLSTLLEEWLIEFSHWEPKTKAKMRSQIELMIELVGDLPVNELTKPILRDRYNARISKIPKKIDSKRQYFSDFKAKKRYPITEIIKICVELNDDRFGPATKRDHVKNVGAFLKWLYTMDYLVDDVRSVLDGVAKGDKTKITKEKAFTDIELKALFECDDYVQGKLMKRPERHWVPLIALFTGARENEICQLRTSDIMKTVDDKNWIFDFYITEDKKAKNKHANRIVPVHPRLISLGFLNYVESVTRSGSDKLFPVCKPDKYGHCGQSVSRWFNGYKTNGSHKLGFKERAGIRSDDYHKKDIHSFRHTLINHTKQNGIDGLVVRELTGHAVHKDVHSRVYEEAYGLDAKVKAIRGIVFPIDFSVMKVWK